MVQNKYEVVCQMCGKKHMAVRRTVKYCPECRKERMKERQRLYKSNVKKTRVCKKCGKVFTVDHLKNTKLCEKCRKNEDKNLINKFKFQRGFEKNHARKPVDDIAAEAKAAGMSYGKYVAMKKYGVRFGG